MSGRGLLLALLLSALPLKSTYLGFSSSALESGYITSLSRNPVPEDVLRSLEDQGGPISVVELDFRVDVFMQLGCSLLLLRSA